MGKLKPLIPVSPEPFGSAEDWESSDNEAQSGRGVGWVTGGRNDDGGGGSMDFLACLAEVSVLNPVHW